MGARLPSIVALSLSCARAATIVFYKDSACQQIQSQSTADSGVLAFSDICTDLNGYGLALSSCSAGSATATVSYVYQTSPGPVTCSPSSLNILGTLSAAQGVCTLISSSSIVSIARAAAYFKITDTACASPPNLVYVSAPIYNTTCFSSYPPSFYLTTSDGSCRLVPQLVQYFSASLAAAGGGLSVAFSGNNGVSCAVTASTISFPSVRLDQSCSVSTDNNWGLLAARPNPYTAPSPSNSPAPYSPPRTEKAIVALVNNASYGGCVSGPGQFGIRFFNGVCNSLGPTDLAVTSCVVGGAVTISIFNATYPTDTVGTCTGPLIYTGTISYGSCSTFIEPITKQPSYLTLLSPPTCFAFTSTSATTVKQFYTSDRNCSGSSYSLTIESDTGGPGSCAIQPFERSSLPYNYSSRVVGGLLSLDLSLSYSPPYACSAADGFSVTCTAVLRDGSCVSCSYNGGAYSFSYQFSPAANYVPVGTTQSQTPSSFPSASRTPSTPASKSSTPTPTRTTSRTASSSPTTSSTSSLTSSSTSSPTASLSVGASPSVTPTETPSPSNSPSSESTTSPTETPTATSDPTTSPSETPTPSSSASLTATSGGGGGGGAAAASSSVAASVGGAVGGLVLLAGVGGGVALYLTSTRKRAGVITSKAVPSVVVLNPTIQGGGPARAPPPPVMVIPPLPPGWSRHEDAQDVWYLDPSGNSQWTHPVSGV